MSFPPRYASQPAKKTRKNGEQTRQRALQVAVAQIAEVGFHKMAISDIAAKAGVSQSGLLHHFPSKAALLAAVLEQREHEDSEFLFGDGTTPLGWAAFDSLVSLAARNETRPDWVRVFVIVAAEATQTDHPAREWIDQHYQSVRQWLTDAIEHGIETGRIRPEIPTELVVTNTIAVLDGVQQQWIVAPDKISMIRSVREYVDMLKRLWALEP